MDIPRFIKVKQFFNKEKVEDIQKKVRDEILNSEITINSGSQIAIAVGSRGIRDIHIIVKSTIKTIKNLGGEPFIVPAMGSHGGATSQGQKELLESYGITEDYIGAPIKSSMDVVELPKEELQNRVYIDKFAYESDGVILINRIKPHTDFHSIVESGLLKMCVIGLGKHKGASEIHKFGVYGLKNLIMSTAKKVIKHGNIILGIGIVENAYDEPMIIKAMRPEDFEREEPKLLEIARRNMPSLPLDTIDVLIIDQMGKDINGVGIDPNIIGRLYIEGEKEPEKPKITRIIVADLTEKSHGNALGVGLADFITRKLYEKIDFNATYQNVLTSTFLQRAKIPVIAPNPKKALEYALMTCGPIEYKSTRIIRIKDTLSLGELYVSRRALDEIKNNKIEVIGDFLDLFDGEELIGWNFNI